VTGNAFQARLTRVRIIHLRNDHKEIMKHLERGLHAHFAALEQASAASATTPTPATQTTINPAIATSQNEIVEIPFAKVNSIVNGSPADQAGLKVGDRICSFGGVNWVNHARLSKVAEVVQQNEGVSHSNLIWSL
jgi:26S proteasome regulatory subunit N4